MFDTILKNEKEYFKNLAIGECMDVTFDIPSDVPFESNITVCRIDDHKIKAKIGNKQEEFLLGVIEKRKMRDDEFKNIKRMRE